MTSSVSHLNYCQALNKSVLTAGGGGVPFSTRESKWPYQKYRSCFDVVSTGRPPEHTYTPP